MKKIIVVCLVLAVRFSQPMAGENAAVPEWMQKPVFFSLDQEPTGRFLADLANRIGVSSYVSPKIGGTVSGEFNLPNTAKLLELLAKGSGIRWYHDGGKLFFYTNQEIENTAVALRAVGVDKVVEQLRVLGAYDPRYEMRTIQKGDEKTGETIVHISAPPRYVEVINNLVNTIDEKPREDKEMRLFRLRHAWARDQKVNMSDGEQTIPGVATLLQRIVASDFTNRGMGAERAAVEARNTIMPDLRLNAVIVWETKERMGYFETLIRDLDQETELVEIRVAIIDVGVDASKELGLGYGYSRGDNRLMGGVGLQDGNPGPDGVDDLGLPQFTRTLGSGLNAYTILGGGLNKFMVRVNALEQKGDAKLLSRPAILTLDNVQSTFTRNETFYVRLEGKDEVSLEEVTYGTTLNVVPHIIAHPDGRRRIQMQITIEDGSAADTGEVDNIPRTVNSRVETQAIVAEGQALVIGGHYSEVNRNSKSGVPILSRLPGFGALFRNTRKNTSTYERLFVISPRIITIGDIPMVQSDDELKASFDNQIAPPVYRMPSASDSDAAIQLRREREEAELQKNAAETIEEDKIEGGEPAMPPMPAPEFPVGTPEPDAGALFTLPRGGDAMTMSPPLSGSAYAAPTTRTAVPASRSAPYAAHSFDAEPHRAAIPTPALPPVPRADSPGGRKRVRVEGVSLPSRLADDLVVIQ